MVTDSQPCVLFDMDGTLCDVSSVRHHVATKPKRFDLFHREAASCPPIEWVAEVARMWDEAGIAVVIVTARMEMWRESTQAWLDYNNIPWVALFMRKDKDYRKDVIVKDEILTMVNEHGYVPCHAYDDNPNVIGLWVSKGIGVTTIPGWSVSPVQQEEK